MKKKFGGNLFKLVRFVYQKNITHLSEDKNVTHRDKTVEFLSSRMPLYCDILEKI